MNIRLGFLVVFALVLAVGCRSKKGLSVSDMPPNDSSCKDLSEVYQNLSKRVNLPITSCDDTTLYLFVADWLGTPHKLGKCTKKGVDCSCFVKMLYQQVYAKQSPRTAHEMFEASEKVSNKELVEGDLVFFKIKSKKVSHVGIYLKEGWFAHVSSSNGVTINNLNEKYYNTYFAGAGRIQ
jgi:lipoprotein Spr